LFGSSDKKKSTIIKLGDLTVVDGDPTQVPREAIKDIGVAMTIIDGAVVYANF
jgi:predicted amidohydrolase YtcJ